MIAWLLYATLVGALLALSAAALEPLLRSRGRPVRWLWVAAAVGTVAGGGVLPLRHAPASVPEPAPAVAQPVMNAAEVSAVDDAVVVPPDAARRDTARFDRPVAAFWVGASLLLLFSLLWAAHRVAVLKRAGRRRRVAGVRLLTDAPRGPAATGVVVPCVVLPAWMRQLEPRERRFMVAHEIEHLRAHDPLVKLGGLAAIVLMPWNVGLWWILRRLLLAIEIDCDNRVLRRYDAAHAYASFLLDVARRRRTVPTLALAVVHRAHFLERRLVAMTQRQSRTVPRRSARLALAAAALIAVVTLDAPLPPAFAQAADAAPPAAAGPVVEYGTIVGTVIDHDGAPLAGAHVSIAEPHIAAVTNVEGRFMLVRVPEGAHAVTVAAQGYRSQQVARVPVVADQSITLQITMSGIGQADVPALILRELRSVPTAPPPPPPPPTAPAAAVVVGTVLDADGNRIAGARITVIGDEQGTISNREGRFLLFAEAGTVSLRITAPGYRTAEMRDVRVDLGQRVTVDIVMAPAGAPVETSPTVSAAPPPAAAPTPALPVSQRSRLGQSYPNPFNPETRIPFTLFHEDFAGRPVVVTIRIVNLLGSVVAYPVAVDHEGGSDVETRDISYTTPGFKQAYWNGLNLRGEPVASGPYVVEVIINGQRVANSVVIRAAG